MTRAPTIVMLDSVGEPDVESAVPALLRLFGPQLDPIIETRLKTIGAWVVDLFLSEVEQIPIAGCWIWTGRVDGNGYGRAAIGDQYFGAHKLSFILFNGDVPEGLHVCHRCDVPLCVNPHHLFAGTRSQNMSDAFRKGRLIPPTFRGEPNPVRGEQHYRARLNQAKVDAIRASDKTDTELAREHGVDRSTIRSARTGKSWRKTPQK